MRKELYETGVHAASCIHNFLESFIFLSHFDLAQFLPRAPIRFACAPCYVLAMPTAAQIAANQANAQLSTGPTSETGKAKSSLNAVKTGLTGRTVLLPGDDAALYEAHVSHVIERYQPADDEERNLVQSLADTEWRLLRIPSLEMGIYAVGRLEFAELFSNEDEAVRNHLIEAKIFLAYQRQLNNLSIQENRLRRQREKDTAVLRELQDGRKRQVKARLDKAAYQYIAAVQARSYQTFEPQAFGFEFSLADIEVRAMEIDPNLFADYEQELREQLKAA
jgi:hypothetical protein